MMFFWVTFFLKGIGGEEGDDERCAVQCVCVFVFACMWHVGKYVRVRVACVLPCHVMSCMHVCTYVRMYVHAV